MGVVVRTTTPVSEDPDTSTRKVPTRLPVAGMGTLRPLKYSMALEAIICWWGPSMSVAVAGSLGPPASAV